MGLLWICLVISCVTSINFFPGNLSLLAVAQALISLIHDFMQLSYLNILSGGADIYNSNPLANKW